MPDGWIRTAYKDGRWTNEVEGGGVLASYETKDEAVSAGRKAARNSDTEHVIVERAAEPDAEDTTVFRVVRGGTLLFYACAGLMFIAAGQFWARREGSSCGSGKTDALEVMGWMLVVT